MRDLVGFDGATRDMADGTPYGYHWTGTGSAPTDAPPAPKGIACAPPEVRDRAYRAMLDAFELSEQHRQHLRHRGLSPGQVATLTLAGYRTLPDYHERARAIRAAIDSLGGGDPLAIPGLHRGNSSWRLAGRPGLLIPVRDVAGRIVACKIRPDDPGPDGAKYVWLSSTAHDGASPGAPAHVAAIRTTTGSTALRIGRLLAEQARSEQRVHGRGGTVDASGASRHVEAVAHDDRHGAGAGVAAHDRRREAGAVNDRADGEADSLPLLVRRTGGKHHRDTPGDERPAHRQQLACHVEVARHDEAGLPSAHVGPHFGALAVTHQQVGVGERRERAEPVAQGVRGVRHRSTPRAEATRGTRPSRPRD
jgi:hypothetical protein